MNEPRRTCVHVFKAKVVLERRVQILPITNNQALCISYRSAAACCRALAGLLTGKGSFANM